jgi:hypothetical protein
MSKRQSKGTEKPKRGRKASEDKILSNGLYQSQWARIQSDAKAEGIDAAVFLRRTVNWFYTAKEQQAERQEAEYAHIVKFNKLQKAKE